MINVSNTKLLGQMCLDNFVYDPIESELEIFVEFFDQHDLNAHCKILKRWKAVVTSGDYFETNTLNSPLHEHKMMCNLLNAAWLIVQNPSVTSKLVNLDQIELNLNQERLMSDCYPTHLSKSEQIDPFSGIRNFFELYTLQRSHQTLYEWLNLALSPNMQVGEQADADAFYCSFRRLMECCWLIQYRETLDWPSQTQQSSPIEGPEKKEEVIPGNLINEFKQFLAVVPANRLNRGLRKMLIDYLHYNMNGLPVDFEELLADFYWLTELLDEIQGKQVDERFR